MKILKFSLLAVLLIVITSCNQTNKKMMELIPENSTLVASINTSIVIDHMGITVGDNGKVQLPGELKKLVSDNQKEFDEAMQKMEQANIDPSANIYCYADIVDRREGMFVMLAATKDDDKTKVSLMEETKKNFKNVEGVDVLALDHNGVAAIKDGIVAIVAGNSEDIENAAVKALSKADKSVLENDEITSVLDDDSDINMYVNYSSYMNLMAKIQPQMSLIAGFMSGIRGCGVMISLADNEVNAKSEIFADDDSDIMRLYKEIQGEPSADFLKYMPADAKLMASLSIKGDKLAEFAQVKSALQMISNNPGFGNADFVELVKSINGPIALGMDGDVKSISNTFGGAFVLSTSKPAEWKKVFDTLFAVMGSSMVQYSVEEKADAVVVKFGKNIGFASDASKIDAAKSMFTDNFSGMYFNLKVDGMTMVASAYNKDIKHGEGKFLITGKDGKNMIFGDYPLFFKAFQQSVIGSSAPVVYDELEPDSDLDTLAYDTVAI